MSLAIFMAVLPAARLSPAPYPREFGGVHGSAVKVREAWPGCRIPLAGLRAARPDPSGCETMKLYRYLTGPDDASFCHRVSEALSKGWQLHGNPTLTFDSVQQRVICGQAVTKEVDGEYLRELKLGEQ
jgi:hypothetical protein